MPLPLSDDEKKRILREGVFETARYAKRHEAELRQIRETAQAMFWGLVAAPTWQIVEAPLPEDAQVPAEGWHVTAKVTSD